MGITRFSFGYGMEFGIINPGANLNQNCRKGFKKDNETPPGILMGKPKLLESWPVKLKLIKRCERWVRWQRVKNFHFSDLMVKKLASLRWIESLSYSLEWIFE